MRRTTKYTWQEYKSVDDILLEFKINTVVEKIQNYRNKYVQHVRRMDRDRQTACHI
jgi:endonuclease I